MKYIDMHTHTTASDGHLTPTQLIDYALNKKLNGISITDHDSISGLEEGEKYAERFTDFLFIPGLELSTEYQQEEIHILGYSIHYQDKELVDVLYNLQNQRKIRAQKIITKLNHLGLNITYDEVLKSAKEGNVGRAHIARVLFLKGYVENMKMAFIKYLSKGCPAYVPRYKLTPMEAIRLIKKVEGYAVLAHPGLLEKQDLIQHLIDMKLDGIEVYHPEHRQEDIERFIRIATQHNLVITGGSDFHDIPSRYCHNGDVGSYHVPIKNISSFIK